MMTALVVALFSGAAVDQVVLFPDRALVTRTETVACGPRATVGFKGITPAAAPDSFRARASQGEVVGLRTAQVARREALSPQLKQLDEQLRVLNAQQALFTRERTRLEAKAKRADALADVGVTLAGKELAGDVGDPKGWDKAFDVALDARVQVGKALAALGTKERALAEQRAEVQRKRGELSFAAERLEYQAEVLVSCASGQATVQLTYLVGGARWEPAWEARAQEASKSVELSAWATVRQATGEAWDGAKLVLSTAVPTQNATPPTLNTLLVEAQEREPPQKVLTRRDEDVKHAEAPGAGVAGPSQGLTARAQGLSVQLEVPGRQTVPGDGNPMRLFVARTTLAGTFTLRAAPRLSPAVFQVVELVNRAPFPLLPGPLDVFRSTGFVARTRLDRVAEGARFNLTLGVEDAVRLKRSVVEEVKRSAGAFGGKQRFQSSYRFEVASYAEEPIELELQEPVPLSELDDVSVAVANTTTPGFTRDGEDGIVKWAVKLRPKEKKQLLLSWTVDVPSSYDTSGF